jgi:hypothetical protein
LTRSLSSNIGGEGSSGVPGGGRGRGRDALRQFIQDNQPVVNSVGPKSHQPSSSSGSPRLSGKGAGKGMSSGGGGGGRFGRRNSNKEMISSKDKEVFVVQGGQFDHKELNEEQGSLEDMLDDLFEMAYQQDDGILIIDYEAPKSENDKIIAKFSQSNARTLNELLDYSKLETTFGAEKAATAHEFTKEAWKISAANPHITHEQRSEMVQALDSHLKEFEEKIEEDGGRYDFVLTPPAGHIG